jgi:hypothetical protein
MKTPIVGDLLVKLKEIQALVKALNPDMENFRSYYKHQTTDEDDISESAIISWGYINDIDHVIESMEEMRDLEFEDETN